VLLLTVIILWVRHNQSKGSQKYDIHKVEEQVGKVKPSTKSVPLVVEEAGHQRVLEELTTVVLHLNQQQIRHVFHRYFRNMITSLVPRLERTWIGGYHLVHLHVCTVLSFEFRTDWLGGRLIDCLTCFLFLHT